MNIQDRMDGWLQANRDFLLDIYRLLWVVFLALYGLRIINLWIPDSFNLWWIALVLGAIGLLLLDSPSDAVVLNRRWVVIAIGFALLVRIIPYIGNTIPLGYDPGLYKRVFESPLTEGTGIHPLPFAVILSGLTRIFGFNFVMIPLFILITSATVWVIYKTTSRMLSHNIGIAAALMFGLSVTQYDVFLLNYYKNALGIIALLGAFLFFDRSRRLDWGLIALGVLIGGMHQIALAVFGLAYGLYWIFNLKNHPLRENLIPPLNGVIILVLTFLTNFDRADIYLFNQAAEFFGSVSQVTSGGASNAGQYLDPLVYFNLNAPLIALALPGIKTAKGNRPLMAATIALAVLIVFRLFFYRRFLIYFDIFLLIFAASGWLALVSNSGSGKHFRTRYWPAGALIALMAAKLVFYAAEAKPSIIEAELLEIQHIGRTLPSNSTLVALDSTYFPWLHGWTDYEIEAPGMWGDHRTRQQWLTFWQGNNEARIPFLSEYSRPLYLVDGRTDLVLTPFDSTCFERIEGQYFTLYKVLCE